jgi:GntR family transcriptional regulator / MocR family aminotransferase
VVSAARASPVQWGAFVPGVPDVRLAPQRQLAQAQARLAKSAAPTLLTYAHGGGHEGLRQALAEHLRQARTVVCDADQILITEGVHQAIDLSTRMLSDAGDLAWLEEPGYWGIRGVLAANGLQVRPVPVDAEGLQLPAATSAPPRLIFVTPSHQYPLGSVMSLARRLALLELAQSQGSWIIEDDYDSEYRFAGRPVPSLQGLRPQGRVIYIGTFSKTLFPGLRTAYMVLPRALAQAFRTAHAELYREGHQLAQAALGAWVMSGQYAAHIRRTRLVYGARRALLRGLVERRLGPDWLHPHDSEAGLHLVLALPPSLSDVAVAAAAAARGVTVRPLSRYYAGPDPQQGLLLGFACVSESEMLAPFETLLACLREAAP